MMSAEISLYHRFGSIHRRRMLIVFAMILALVFCLVLDLMAGPAELAITDILGGIIDPQSLDLRHRIILWDVRLPDALIALAVGAALGLAGIETQTILDNPLASPFTLGVSSASVDRKSVVWGKRVVPGGRRHTG